jgi:ribosomal protein S18 acetylase RimI-like enzyme
MTLMQVDELRQMSVSELEPVLNEEFERWRQQLFWDNSAAVHLLRGHLRRGTLTGFGLWDANGQVYGYTYGVFDKPVGYLGSTYVLDQMADRRHYSTLVSKVVEKLESREGLSRIEAQVFSFNHNIEGILRENGFRVFPRYFLTRRISAEDRLAQSESAPECRTRLWQASDFEAATETLHDSYHLSPDFDLCHDYKSLGGCSRLLRNLLNNPGCGQFCPDSSLVALDETDSVVGILMASLISPGTGMVCQLSVRRSNQKLGIGRQLLRDHLDRALKLSRDRACLSVTAHNHDAVSLYATAGFRRHKEFHACVKEMGLES